MGNSNSNTKGKSSDVELGDGNANGTTTASVTFVEEEDDTDKHVNTYALRNFHLTAAHDKDVWDVLNEHRDGRTFHRQSLDIRLPSGVAAVPVTNPNFASDGLVK